MILSCSRSCDDSIYFTLINKSSEKIKFITFSSKGNEEYILKSGKSINFDSYPPQTNLRILPSISKLELVILSNNKKIKDSCDFSKGNNYCEADRGFF